jgi:hypothetical protein
MKVLKATCFVLCQFRFYTTILTATVPSLLQNHPGPTLNTTTPTTLARPSALIDYPITGTPTGSVYFYSYGPPLNATDTKKVLRDARIEIYDHVRIDPDAFVGRLLEIYIRGNVELVLAPKRSLTWEIWSAAFDAVRMFYVALDVAMIFEVVDAKFGYVGGGWMTLLLG